MLKKPATALEMAVNITENFPKPLADYWGAELISKPVLWFDAVQKTALETGAAYVCVKFNIKEDESEIKSCVELLKLFEAKAKIPLIIRGSGQKDFDSKLIPALVECVKSPSVIAFAQDTNYKPIISAILKSPLKADLKLVLRAPIDINLSKELNILSTDFGLNPENIIMDTDTGCVGMGLDYGYSIIEKIKEAAASDADLNHPIIVFAGEESFKSKESKTDDFSDTRGSLAVRAFSIETSTATALLCAGADILVLQNPKTICAINSLFKEEEVCQI